MKLAKRFRRGAAALVCGTAALCAASLPRASGAGLPTVERTMSTYAFGERSYTCLAIDGGFVPLNPPINTKLEVGSNIRIVWPTGIGAAVFRSASITEAGLLNMMDAPQAATEWKKYFLSTLPAGAEQVSVGEFQPNILAVNHWRIGSISLEYILGGVKYSGLRLLWRCQDGTAIAVTLESERADFKERSDAICQMIGASMLMKD